MKNVFKSKLFILILGLFFVLSTLSVGCKNKKDKLELENQSIQPEQQSENIPEELEDIEKNIEKIINALGGPTSSQNQEENSLEEAKSSSDKKESTSKKEESTSGKGDSDSEQGESSSEDNSKPEKEKSESEDKSISGGNHPDPKENEDKTQDKDTGEKKEEKTTKSNQNDLWKKVLPVIDKLHYDWNSYTPKAAKMRANNELLDNFSKTLNLLTKSADVEDHLGSLLSANLLYGYIPDFYSLYRGKTSPEIKRIRYYIRSAALNSRSTDWEQCDSDINSLKSIWSFFKNTLEKETQELASTLDFSIYELEKVILERNHHLIDIKSRVGLSNVDALEEAIEKASTESKDN